MKQLYIIRLWAIVFSLFPFMLSAQQSATVCESIQIQTIDNELVVSGLDLANTKARIYDDAYQLVTSCEFNCAASMTISNVNDGEVYHLTFEFFSDDFGYLTQENIDYSIGTEALEIGICLGNVTLGDQAAVDAFCGCEIITGLLDIGDRFNGANDIDNLSNLSEVKAVPDLRVNGTNLTSLEALANLKIGRGIGIFGNPLLESIDGFNQMEVIQDIGISNNPALKQINGFKQLKEIELVLFIGSNSQLTTLNGFGLVEIAAGFSFQNNDAFQTLDELPLLQQIGRRFSIRNNALLKTIQFSALNGNVEDFSIVDNPVLENLPTIGAVNIAEYLDISGNSTLSDCCELVTLFDEDLTNGYYEGRLVLRDNGDLCNSTLDILENCGGTTPADCDAITLESENNQLIINNVTAPIAIIKVYDENFQPVFDCNNNCASTIIISDLNTCETYTVDVQLYNENFELICDRKFSTMVNGTPAGNPICKGDIILRSQADVDDFCGCSKIAGSLYIGFQAANDIVDISNLSTVTEVTEFVGVYQTQLSNLSDLNIKKIGRSLTIDENPLLADVDAFNELVLGEFLSIRLNPNLKDISGFQQVDSFQTVSISSNASLTTISGFGNLNSVYGINLVDNFALLAFTAFKNLENSTSQVVIKGNESLQRIAFPLLKTTAILNIEENPNLSTVDDFDELNVSFLLQIQKNVALTDCCFLKDLVDDDFSNGFVGGEIRIRNNGEMCGSIADILSNCTTTSPVGCENIQIIAENNQLAISGINAPNAIVKVFDNNWQLAFDCNANCEDPIILTDLNAGDIYHTDIQFYDANWQFICLDKQDIEIKGGDPCVNICQGDVTLRTQAEVDAFCGCEVVEGDLVIGYEPDEGDAMFSDIVNLESMKDLRTVKGQLIIGKTELTSINGLAQLKEVGSLVMIANENLSSIDGLSQLDKINLIFFTANNPSLTNIDVLGNLTFLGNLIIFSSIFEKLPQFDQLENESFAQLIINQSDNLQSLQGLEKIKSIKGDGTINPVLEIFLNPILTDISALQQIELVEGRFNISVNSLLTDCCAIAHLVDDNPANGMVNGEISVFGNPSFCSSIEEVLNHCSSSSSICENVSISTNEGTRSITISNLNAPIEIVKVFDENWQKIYECFADCETEIQLDELSGSRYHIQIDMYDENWTPICDLDETIEFFNNSENRNGRLQATDFTLHPNPALEEAFINLERLKGEAVTLKILNQFGQEVYQKNIKKVIQSTERIEVSNFSNGLYLLQIQPSNRRAISKKMVVNRLY